MNIFDRQKVTKEALDMMEGQTAPLVYYDADGERHVVGEATMGKNGAVSMKVNETGEVARLLDTFGYSVDLGTSRKDEGA